MSGSASPPQGQRAGGLLGSLKDALAAASRDETGQPGKAGTPAAAPAEDTTAPVADQDAARVPSAAEAAREARGAPASLAGRRAETDPPPTTRVVKSAPKATTEAPVKTQLVRGKVQVKRGSFEADPVAGWLVVVGGPGIGQFRPIFEGNNTIGRGTSNRVPLTFGDETISTDEQAYIRYDSADRSFLFVPNLSKTNVVSVNDKRPTGAVELAPMDVITMGHTQLAFVPFCGSEFDWSAISGDRE